MRPLLAVALLAAAGLAPSSQAGPDPRGPGAVRRSVAPASSAVPAEGAPDLRRYRLLTVVDLATAAGLQKTYQQELGRDLSDRLAMWVGREAGLGLEVRRGEPLGRADELVLTGEVVRARRGNRALRYFVGPLARARLVAHLRLQDGRTGDELTRGTVKKLWAWPGLAGASRGLSGLVEGACREVVDYLARTRPAGPAEAAERVGQ